MTSINCRITEDALNRLAHIAGRSTGDEGDTRETVLLVVSLVEEYVDALLDRLVDASGAGESAFGRIMLEKLQTGWHQTWTARREWLKDGFDVDWSTTSGSSKFATLLDLRNTLTHGGHALTGNQTKTLRSQLGLEKHMRDELLVRFDGRTIHLSASTAAVAIKVVDDLIRGLDAELSDTPQSVKVATLT